MTEVWKCAWTEGDIRRVIAVKPSAVRVREAETEVLDERVRDEEFGKCNADGRHSVPTADLQCGKVGKVKAKELNEGLLGCGGAGEKV